MIKYFRGDVVLILFLVVGYLFGSIPWGLIIGKVFFNKDIRLFGSGNLGGTNAGRVLGRFYGILVGVLDAIKAFVVVWLVSYYDHDIAILAGAMAAVGHCYPLFAGFKGGKAVASTFGMLFGIGLFVTGNHIMFFASFTTFLLLLVSIRMVSLSSMITMLVACLTSFFQPSLTAQYTIIGLTLFIIYRHRVNIKRIIARTEPKISVFKRTK